MAWHEHFLWPCFLLYPLIHMLWTGKHECRYFVWFLQSEMLLVVRLVTPEMLHQVCWCKYFPNILRKVSLKSSMLWMLGLSRVCFKPYKYFEILSLPLVPLASHRDSDFIKLIGHKLFKSVQPLCVWTLVCVTSLSASTWQPSVCNKIKSTG